MRRYLAMVVGWGSGLLAFADPLDEAKIARLHEALQVLTAIRKELPNDSEFLYSELQIKKSLEVLSQAYEVQEAEEIDDADPIQG